MGRQWLASAEEGPTQARAACSVEPHQHHVLHEPRRAAQWAGNGLRALKARSRPGPPVQSGCIMCSISSAALVALAALAALAAAWAW